MPETIVERAVALPSTAGFDRLLTLVAVALPLGTMIQLLLPLGRAGLAVTLSDAVVALALPILAIRAATGRRPQIESLVPRLLLWLGLMTAALILGFLIGYARLGLQPWGMTRVLGWIMLLGHLLVAAWIASNQAARTMALRAFVLAAAASAGLELCKTAYYSVLVSEQDCAWASAAFGMMQNPNALAIILVTALAVAIGALRSGLPGVGVADDLLIVLLVVGIGLTASRSAWLSAIAVVGMAFAFGWTRRLRAGIDVAVGLAIVALLFTVLICGKTSAVTDHANVVVSALSESKIDGSNIERLYSWRGAFDLFMAYPFFGAGFGAFLESELARGSTPLIIHSTLFWLFAEAGLVGGAAYLSVAIAIAGALVRHIRFGTPDNCYVAATALLVGVGFAIMSSLQELLYQRCLWVVLALLIFHPVPRPVQPSCVS